jgi:hypothetical protein
MHLFVGGVATSPRDPKSAIAALKGSVAGCAGYGAEAPDQAWRRGQPKL